MATNQSGQPIDADVREHLDAIDGTLREQLEQDERLTSGVPDAQRGDDLGFIQMSGLTRPRLAEHPASAPAREDLDPSRPVNFFEAGVADVDASMDPGSYDSAAADSEDLGNAGAPSETAKGLREILAQLGSEGVDAEPSPEDDPPAPPLSVEDTLDAQSLVDAGGAELLRREIESEPPLARAAAAVTPVEVTAETEPVVEAARATPDMSEGSLPDEWPSAADDFITENASPELDEDAVTEALLSSLYGVDAEVAADATPEIEMPVTSAPVASEDGTAPVELIDAPERSDAIESNDALFDDAAEAATMATPDEPTPAPVPTEPAFEEIPDVPDASQADDAAPGVEIGTYDASMTELDFLQTPSIDESLRLSLDAPPAPEPELGPAPAFVPDEAAAAAEPADTPEIHSTGARLNSDWSGRLYDDTETNDESTPMAVMEASALPAPQVDLRDSSPSWLQPQEGPLLARRQHRRSKSRRRSLHRRIRRWTIRGLAGVILLGALGAVAWSVRDMIEPPINLYMEAQQLASAGEYWEASRRYETFASRNPGDTLRPVAEFEAAQVLAQIEPSGQDERTEVNRRQLALYQSFVENNPGHPKVARAARLIAQLQFELGQYEDVIRNYRPELQVQDPASALPALRLVARAYEQMDEIAQAESAYLRASSMDGNLAPERDYEALADLHHRLAEGAPDDESRAEHYTKALEYLERATQSTTIDPAFREQLRLKQGAWRTAQSDAAGDAATATEADPTTIAAPGMALESPAAVDEPPVEDAVLDRELDGAAETEHLEQVMTQASPADKALGEATPKESAAP